MFNNQNDTEVELIRSKIAELPAGSISYKTIKGKRQSYLQWTQDGRTRSRYLKADERESIIAQVEERKRLEARLGELGLPKAASPDASKTLHERPEYHTNYLTGKRLDRFDNSCHRLGGDRRSSLRPRRPGTGDEDHHVHLHGGRSAGGVAHRVWRDAYDRFQEIARWNTS